MDEKLYSVDRNLIKAAFIMITVPISGKDIVVLYFTLFFVTEASASYEILQGLQLIYYY